MWMPSKCYLCMYITLHKHKAMKDRITPFQTLLIKLVLIIIIQIGDYVDWMDCILIYRKITTPVRVNVLDDGPVFDHFYQHLI